MFVTNFGVACANIFQHSFWLLTRIMYWWHEWNTAEIHASNYTSSEDGGCCFKNYL